MITSYITPSESGDSPSGEPEIKRADVVYSYFATLPDPLPTDGDYYTRVLNDLASGDRSNNRVGRYVYHHYVDVRFVLQTVWQEGVMVPVQYRAAVLIDREPTRGYAALSTIFNDDLGTFTPSAPPRPTTFLNPNSGARYQVLRDEVFCFNRPNGRLRNGGNQQGASSGLVTRQWRIPLNCQTSYGDLIGPSSRQPYFCQNFSLIFVCYATPMLVGDAVEPPPLIPVSEVILRSRQYFSEY